MSGTAPVFLPLPGSRAYKLSNRTSKAESEQGGGSRSRIILFLTFRGQSVVF